MHPVKLGGGASPAGGFKSPQNEPVTPTCEQVTESLHGMGFATQVSSPKASFTPVELQSLIAVKPNKTPSVRRQRPPAITISGNESTVSRRQRSLFTGTEVASQPRQSQLTLSDPFGSPVRVRDPPQPGSAPPQYNRPLPTTGNGTLNAYGTHTMYSPRSAHHLAPGMFVPSLKNDAIPQTLFDVPEFDTVWEFGYRAGQQGRGRRDGRYPANPFTPELDHVWRESHDEGKISEAKIREPGPRSASPSGYNYTWSPLINVYTQTPEYPNGSYDADYARKVVEAALKAMEDLIEKIKRRGLGWDKLVADIPEPIAEACYNFPDLAQRYSTLKQSAKAARMHRPPTRDSPIF